MFKIVEILQANPEITREKWQSYMDSLLNNDDCDDPNCTSHEEINSDEIASWVQIQPEFINKLPLGAHFRALDDNGFRALYLIIAKDDDETTLYIPIAGTEEEVIGLQKFNLETHGFETVAVFDLDNADEEVDKIVKPHDIIRFIDAHGLPYPEVSFYEADPNSTYIVADNGQLLSVNALNAHAKEYNTLSALAQDLNDNFDDTNVNLLNSDLFQDYLKSIKEAINNNGDVLGVLEQVKDNIKINFAPEDVAKVLSLLGKVLYDLSPSDDENEIYNKIAHNAQASIINNDAKETEENKKDQIVESCFIKLKDLISNGSTDLVIIGYMHNIIDLFNDRDELSHDDCLDILNRIAERFEADPIQDPANEHSDNINTIAEMLANKLVNRYHLKKENTEGIFDDDTDKPDDSPKPEILLRKIVQTTPTK